MENMSSKAAPLSSDFFVSLNDPRVLWNDHWLAVVIEVVGVILLYQVCMNAKRRKSETLYLILAAAIASTTFEILPFFRQGYVLWWYHPGLFNILWARLPSYVISSFALSHHVADSLTKGTNLPTLTRSFVTAIFGLLISSPFLWMAPRLLLVTYHFDDPIFTDRIFDVPIVQLLVVFLLFFHTSHLFYENCEELSPQQRNTLNYTLCGLQSGLVAAIYATVEQYVLYMFFKLTLSLHVGVCFLVAATVLTFLAKREITLLQIKSTSVSGIFHPLKYKSYWALVGGLIFLISMSMCLNLEDLKSTGSRLELGPCHVMQQVSNTNPLDITRRRFVCPEDTKILNYDFHCVPQKELSFAVKDIRKVYTICGKALNNYLQTTQIMAAYSVMCLLVFTCVMRLSFTFQNEKQMAPKKID